MRGWVSCPWGLGQMQSSGAPHLTAEEVTGRRRRGGGDGGGGDGRGGNGGGCVDCREVLSEWAAAYLWCVLCKKTISQQVDSPR